MDFHQKKFTFFKGRVALHAILRAAGIGPNDEVLLPGYTCVVVPNAIIYSGARPAFLDVDSNTYNLDPNILEDKLRTSPHGKFRAVIVQHTYGIPCDMDAITSIARKYQLLVLEDSCHTLGSKYKDRLVGTFGDAAFFSSQWSKPLTTGLGGWAIVNNPLIQKNMESMTRDYPGPRFSTSLVLAAQFAAFKLLYHPKLFWSIQSLYRSLGDKGLAIGSSTTGELVSELPGDYMQAMGRNQERLLDRILDNVDKDNKTRRRHTEFIEEHLQKAGFPIVNLPAGFDPVYLRYPVRVNNKDQVLDLARQNRVQLGDWFISPVHPNLAQWEMAGYTPGQCPVAEEISRKTVNIATDFRTSETEIARTVTFLKRHAEPTPGVENMESGEF